MVEWFAFRMYRSQLVFVSYFEPCCEANSCMPVFTIVDLNTRSLSHLLPLHSSFAPCTHKAAIMSSPTRTTADSFLFSSILGVLIVAVSYFIMINFATSRRQRYEILENRERQRALESHLPRPSRGTQIMMDWKRNDAEKISCARCGKEVRE